jgi:hypothetical protein
MGFGVEHLGNFLDYDHSTVTYAKKHVYELLESEDKETVMIYTHVKDGFKKRFSDYGDVFQDFRSRLNA